MTPRIRASRRSPSPALGALLLGALLMPGALSTPGASAASPSPSSSDPTAASSPELPLDAERITLQTHDSFALTPEVLGAFEAATGVGVDILTSGGAGTLVNQAILAGAEHPLADVIYGIDDAFLSRALDAGILEPYRPAALADVPAELQLDPQGRATPIDFGHVCVNLDLEAFADGDPPLPTRLEDLTDPAYRGMLVVQDPATDSPGLAFLLATIARFGDEGESTWRDFWRALRENDVLVAADWSDAYFSRFSGGANQGDRPMVVSYASSPVAEVVFADPRPTTPPTGVLEDGCYRQVEFAGVLRGTDAPRAARAFVDFLLSPAVQSDIPLNMFVSPALASARIPDDYAAFAATPDAPLSVDPDLIDANRERWIEEWATVVYR
jgi:thiamine transport system substrate-binding protein